MSKEDRAPVAAAPRDTPDTVKAARPRQSLAQRLRLPALRWPVAAATALVLVGVLVVGFGLGWTASRIAGPGELPNTTVEVVAAPTDAGEGTVAVPDVRGLLLVDARQALADAGLPPDAVTTTDAPAALPAGTILRQDPVGGTEGANAVTLFVAVPGTVPDVVGAPAAGAVQILQDLGTAVRQVPRYTPGTPEGTVLAVEPPAGWPLAEEVVLTVSGPPGSVYLAQLDRVEGSCAGDGAGVDGQPYDNSVVCSTSSAGSTTVYLLNRQVTSLEGVVGMADTSDPAATAAVRIVADGQVLLERTVAYGSAVPFELAVTGALRLEVSYSTAGEVPSGRLVLGDARLVGDPAGIDALDAEG